MIATHIWVSALIRRVEAGGGFAYVTKRGEDRAGAVLLKLFNSSLKSACVLSRVGGDEDGRWVRPIRSEDEADIARFIERQCQFDQDLWVIEIEDREGRPFVQEPFDLS